ncbi:SERTA domain-containing protein 1 [Hemicordylus capensis]|uniref:SERTA domain-containing protein 1 n=1 Tax=Hemicordylus capensis TaxID=884348 RepID=UPI0023024C13|nr:SERTA domain-containing protein 1 [Hemicordylus capensis]
MLARGLKRKRSPEAEVGGSEPPAAAAAPPAASSSLFSISLSKLRQSLQLAEPDLRHLVLVANTLRRIQEEMQPAAAASHPQQGLGRGAPWVDSSSPSGHCAVGALQDAGRRLGLPPPPPPAPVDALLLSTMDVSGFSTILEDLSGLEGFSESPSPSSGPPGKVQLCPLSPEPERTSHLEIGGPGGSLLEDGLEGLFEDIDTSMYDSDLWPAPGSLPSFKEAFSRGEAEGGEGLGLEDLDYLMDVIVGAHEL